MHRILGVEWASHDSYFGEGRGIYENPPDEALFTRRAPTRLMSGRE